MRKHWTIAAFGPHSRLAVSHQEATEFEVALSHVNKMVGMGLTPQVTCPPTALPEQIASLKSAGALATIGDRDGAMD